MNQVKWPEGADRDGRPDLRTLPKTPDKQFVEARLLDRVPGRSRAAYACWLTDRGDAFRKRVQLATLDPFRDYMSAIDEQLKDATAVLDAFHVASSPPMPSMKLSACT